MLFVLFLYPSELLAADGYCIMVMCDKLHIVHMGVSARNRDCVTAAILASVRGTISTHCQSYSDERSDADITKCT